MSSIDTNLVLRFLLQDHPTMSPAIADLIHSGRSGEFNVADVVLFECVWIMQGAGYGLDRRLIADLITQLARVDQIKCNNELIKRVMPIFAHHRSVSFIDISLAVYAEINDALPLLTYDKKLAKALPDLVQLVA